MSKILFINSVCGVGSTGRICTDLYELANKKGHQCCIAYGRGQAFKEYETIKIGNKFDIYWHVLLSRLFDKHGFGSVNATKKFIDKIDEYNPDIVHLHNIHGYYINIRILFDYLENHPKIKVVWTLHDCWAFTGHCAHFLSNQCEKWQQQCYQCQIKKSYPKSIVDNSKNNYINKKNIFTSLDNLTIITPSTWLSNLVQKSFLNYCEIKTFHNGIDIEKFNNDNIQNSIQSRKTRILGVSHIWTNEKGYNDFIKLATILDSNDYEIILVGVTEKQKKKLPNSIKGITNVKDIEELAKIYQKADVFFNPTREDNYPTVNLEAQACGTPVVTYNVGGTNETIYSNNSFVINELYDFIELLKNNDFKILKSTLNVDMSKIDKRILLRQYIELYEGIL